MPQNLLQYHPLKAVANVFSTPNTQFMEWFPILAGTFKVLALGTGMFFAIKWHYDQGKKEQDKAMEKRAVLRAAGKVAAIFVLALLSLGLLTFFIIGRLSLDMGMP